MSRLSDRAGRPAAIVRWANIALGALDGDVLVGRGVGEAGDQPEPRLSDPRPDAVDKSQLPDRRVNRPLVNDLLHSVEDRLALLPVEFDRLLLVHFVKVGIVTVDEHAALDDVRFEAGRGVAERAGAGLDDVFERLLGISFDEGRPLDRPQLRPYPDRLKIVQNRLADVRV